MSKLPLISEAEFGAKVLQSQEPVLVDFYADWCGPCKFVTPILEDLVEDYSGRLTIVKVDIDQAEQIAGNYGIMSIPTLLIFKDGKPTGKIVGALPKPQLKAKMDELLGALVAEAPVA